MILLIETVQDFLIKLGIKPRMHILEISISQCPRTDLSKRFLPKPMTTTG